MTDAALRFVLDHRAELFPEAPIVFSGSSPRTRSPAASVAASQEYTVGVAYAETLKLALGAPPVDPTRVRRGQGSKTSRQIESVRAELREFSRRVTLTYLNEEDRAGPAVRGQGHSRREA